MAKETKNQIIHTTIKLFQELGYENTTVDAICRECHITKGTFYYHFKNKEEISRQYYSMFYESGFETLTAELIMMDSVIDQLWKVYEYGIDNAMRLTPALMKAFIIADLTEGLQFYSPLCANREDPITDLCCKLIKKGQDAGKIRKGDPYQLHLTFMSAQYAIAYDWAFHDGKYDEKPIIHGFFKTIFKV